MAIDVNKPSSGEYTTKPTSLASPTPNRDHQDNKNQTIPTITTQDQASAYHTLFTTVFPNDKADNDEDNFHKITLEQIFPDFSDDDDAQPTATTTGTATTAEMTL